MPRLCHIQIACNEGPRWAACIIFPWISRVLLQCAWLSMPTASGSGIGTMPAVGDHQMQDRERMQRQACERTRDQKVLPVLQSLALVSSLAVSLLTLCQHKHGMQRSPEGVGTSRSLVFSFLGRDPSSLSPPLAFLFIAVAV